MDFSSGLSGPPTRLNLRRSCQGPDKGSSHGFTLIELIVVVVIVAIFAGMAMPSFSSLLHRMNVRAASDELYDLLQYARSEAVTRGARVTVSAPVNTTEISVVTGTVTLRKVGSGGLQTGVAISSAVNSVDFTTTGTASTNACFQINYPTDSSTTSQYVTLLTSGRISPPTATKPSGC
ncbi:GspH/FimT family pseudopilin [Pseudomonas sp. NFR16]|uniref:GspH/FimT family pseudopilin n=1 Tax=Pseudomonas sp. NFR16 TaxID=1566248 RepID=UPI0008D47D39|nr:GspH/FimT family pseudopilin [Pseudomonas sp. NFR16]SEJ51684.1 type IV fimbrial biogenesis protein FimU [Pseudomonas sp. NFR16]